MQCWFRHVRSPRAASIARTPSAHRTAAGYPQDSAPRNGADDHRGRRPMSSKLIWFRPTYVIDRDRLMVARKTRACCRRTAVTRSRRRFAACSKTRRPFAGRRPPVRSRHRRKMVAAPDVIETVHVPAAAERAVCTAAPLIASKLLLPLWWFAWRCPWRGGLRLGHWRRLGLGHRGGLGSHRLEWRRPRWLAWTRRVTRVWHGDSLLRNEHRRRGRRPDDLAELVVVFRVGQPPRWGEQQSGERRSPQHRSARPLSGRQPTAFPHPGRWVAGPWAKATHSFAIRDHSAGAAPERASMRCWVFAAGVASPELAGDGALDGAKRIQAR